MENATSPFKFKLIKERYQIKDLIGQGASSYVYKALDLENNKLVSIKLIDFFDQEDLTLDLVKERLKFFRREYELLKRVSHPNVINIFDSGIYEYKYPFIVMEFVEGKTLDRVISTANLTLKQICSFLNQLALGLQAIHKQGIIHRDLNPNNIWVSGSQEQEQIKILDFGTAKIVYGTKDDAYLKTITTSGKIVGTLYYLSPEQCKYQELDERTDIYSLAITVYEMLSGHPPFNSVSPVMIAMGHMRLSPPAIANVANNIQEVVFKALEKDPAKRFSTAIEFANAFEKAANQMYVNDIDSTISKDKKLDSKIPSFWQTLSSWRKK
ncbi:MAG: serine/threonine-protein kinase [Blastocatellia bacterium]